MSFPVKCVASDVTPVAILFASSTNRSAVQAKRSGGTRVRSGQKPIGSGNLITARTIRMFAHQRADRPPLQEGSFPMQQGHVPLGSAFWRIDQGPLDTG